MEFFDKDLQPISFSQYSKLFHDKKYCTVRRSIAGDISIFSVWFGQDQGSWLPGDEGLPRIFGTMAYDRVRKIYDDYFEIFDSTLEQTLITHEIMCKKAIMGELFSNYQ